jgi:Xaa-Pro aminopeptidase
VRIENLVLAVPAVTSEHHDGGEGFGEFLEFETLTLCPIDTRCIEPTLLRDDEVTWLNAYHATVLERLTPRVGPAALQWLQQRTQHFSR